MSTVLILLKNNKFFLVIILRDKPTIFIHFKLMFPSTNQSEENKHAILFIFFKVKKNVKLCLNSRII